MTDGRMNLLITEQAHLREDRLFVEAASRSAGVGLSVFESVREAFEELRPEQVAHCFINVNDSGRYREWEGFAKLFSPNQAHYISGKTVSEIESVVQGAFFGSLIRQFPSGQEEMGTLFGRVLQTANSERSYLTDRYLAPDSEILESTVGRSGQKHEEVEKIRKFFLERGMSSRLVNVIASATDELLMNAMFDAPVDAEGKLLFGGRVRSDDFELKGRQSVKISAVYDGLHAGVTVKDLFGSIQKTKLLKHITKSYMKEPYQVGNDTVGAGLGLATVFQNGGSMMFCCEKGSRTMSSVFFRHTEHFREFKEQVRFVSTHFSG